MPTKSNPVPTHLVVAGVSIEVVRKDIKHLHLAVYPPEGRVRVAAPRRLGDDAVRLAVVARLAWIKRHQARFQAQDRLSPRELVTGESHQFAGRRYRLDVLEHDAPPAVRLLNNRTLELKVRPGADRAKREAVLHAWYRQQLRDQIPPLIAKWEPILGVAIADWRIKRMKTRWGTCNPAARRIWLNLDLAKHPPACLDYVVLHEMLHLLERHHNARFKAHLDRHLPHWRHLRAQLNHAPLTTESQSDRAPEITPS